MSSAASVTPAVAASVAMPPIAMTVMTVEDAAAIAGTSRANQMFAALSGAGVKLSVSLGQNSVPTTRAEVTTRAALR